MNLNQLIKTIEFNKYILITTFMKRHNEWCSVAYKDNQDFWGFGKTEEESVSEVYQILKNLKGRPNDQW